MTTQAQDHLNNNIDFSSLTRNQQKALIATDALAQIATGKFTPRTGRYWSPNWSEDQVDASLAAGPRDPLAASSNGCEVCALGACFVASFLRDEANETKDEPITMATNYSHRAVASLAFFAQVTKRLKRYFDPIEIGLMESAFELAPDYAHRVLTMELGEEEELGVKEHQEHQKLIQAALDFGRQYTNAKDRLEAILKNVIDNCGEFKP